MAVVSFVDDVETSFAPGNASMLYSVWQLFTHLFREDLAEHLPSDHVVRRILPGLGRLRMETALLLVALSLRLR